MDILDARVIFIGAYISPESPSPRTFVYVNTRLGRDETTRRLLILTPTDPREEGGGGVVSTYREVSSIAHVIFAVTCRVAAPGCSFPRLFSLDSDARSAELRRFRELIENRSGEHTHVAQKLAAMLRPRYGAYTIL